MGCCMSLKVYRKEMEQRTSHIDVPPMFSWFDIGVTACPLNFDVLVEVHNVDYVRYEKGVRCHVSFRSSSFLSRSNNEKKQIDKQKQTSVKGKEYKKVNKSSVFFLKNHSCKSNVFSRISARLPRAWSGSL